MNAAITPEIEVKEHPNFRTINVGGVYGMPLGMHFEVIVYSEQFEVAGALSSAQMTMPPRVNRTIECRLIIDPFQAKSIVQWLTTQVNAIENHFCKSFFCQCILNVLNRRGVNLQTEISQQ